jgi:hypothetical protein
MENKQNFKMSGNIFNLIVSIILTAIGLIGNSMVFVILLRKEFRKESYFRYLLASTIVNTLNLVFLWIYILEDALTFDSHTILCKLYQYSSNLIYDFGIWLFMISAIDRLISVKFPMRFTFIYEFKNQILGMIIVFVILAALNTPFFMYNDMFIFNNKTLCMYSQDFLESYSIYIDTWNALICSIIPFFVMTFSAFAIKNTLIEKKKKLLPNNKQKFLREKELFKVMCIVNAFHLFASLPLSILTIVYDILGINYLEELSYDVVNTFIYFNCSFDIFILTFCNLCFRNFIFNLICCRRRETKSNDLVEVDLYVQSKPCKQIHCNFLNFISMQKKK